MYIDMFCPKCGTLLKDTDNFCPKCGAKVDTTRITKEDDQPEPKRNTINIPEPTQKVGNTKAKTKRSNESLVIICFLVILALFIPKVIKNEVDNFVGSDNQSETVQDITYTFGDVVEFDGMEYVVKDCSFEEYMGGLQGLNKAKEGYCYIVLHIDVKNISSSDKSTQSSVFEILYDDNYEYNVSFASYADFYDYNDSIVALGSLEDKIINFEVPIEVRDSGKKIELVLSKNSRFDDEHVIWKLN